MLVMRTALVAALTACAAAVLVAACGNDSAESATPDDAGAPTPRAEGGAAGDGGSAGSTGKRAPTGCLLSTTGFKVGAKAENVARTDVANTATWTGVENALTDDGKFAAVTLAAGQESAKLRVSGFGFAIPGTAETWGIEVELKRRAPDGGVDDHQVNVEIEGKPSRFKRFVGGWPVSIVGTHAYGQAVDTWGVDLFPTDVNKSSFAANIAVKRAADASGPVTAIVDSLKIAIHYCAEPIKR